MPTARAGMGRGPSLVGGITEAEVQDYGDSITVVVPGEWIPSKVEWEYHAVGPFRQDDADHPGGVAATLVTLHPFRGGGA